MALSSGGNVKVLKPVPLVIRTQNADEIAGAVAHPTKPSEIRKLIRSKMARCRICKNRFMDKHIYERHLRDRHPKEHALYLTQQEEEVRQQRKEEFEANRLDEIVSGGFIPPQEDLDASKYEVIVREIPLPGELTGGVPARFDRFGVLFQPKRVYKKKISPQCPFCDKRYRNEYSLKKHIAKKHPACAEWVQCLKCFKSIPSKAEMADHLCEMVYFCFECLPARNLCTDLRLYNHRTKFHRGQNSGFKCNLCNQKFLTPRKLRKHKKMSHVFTKTYQCHFCEELFISETAVTTHERIHTGIIKFECKVCDFKCNRFLNMEDHVKEEHGYLCSICQNKLSEWGDLKNHMLIEHGGYLSSEFNSGYIESPRVWLMFKGD
uniref:C2H2-type domain-containing protein n=1 Tax=Globodera pallida TaxID=36090 RepID=A0A183C032_GLOPA